MRRRKISAMFGCRSGGGSSAFASRSIKLGLAGFERSNPIFQLGARHAVEDRLDRFVELAVHALQFAFARLPDRPLARSEAYSPRG